MLSHLLELAIMMMKVKVLMKETPRQQRKMGFLFKGRARPYWSRALQVKGYQGTGQHHRRPLGRNSRNIATLPREKGPWSQHHQRPQRVPHLIYDAYEMRDDR